MNPDENEPTGKRKSIADVMNSPVSITPPRKRIEAIDLARGTAVALMILSHGVNGLMPFSDFTEWGKYVHLITKFSSSLFIIVFGIALAIAHLPHVQSSDWPRRRVKLMLTGVVILFWYKILTIVEMNQFSQPSDIVDALLYRSFPSFVEILGFYAIALLWAPLLLVVWNQTPLFLRLISPLLLIGVNQILACHFDFWGIEQIEAILIEHEDYYTWGQLARGPLVLLGLLIGEYILKTQNDVRSRIRLNMILVSSGIIMFLSLYILIVPNVTARLIAIARNVGKHPPDLPFMLFSVGGALLILSFCLFGGDRLAVFLRPVTIIGTNALMAFIFHIFVIFIVFRYLLGYWQAVSHGYALSLALLLIPATALWIKLTSWVRRYRQTS